MDLYRRHRDLVPVLLRRCLSAVDSEISEAIQSFVSTGDLLSAISVTLDPKGYSDAGDFRKDYLLTEAFSKYPYWDLKIDRRQVAIAKFLEMESHCTKTNSRLSSPSSWNFETTSIIEIARRKIERLLGPLNWNEVATGFRHGPGGTTRLKRLHADAYYKFSGKPETTHNNLVLSDAVLKHNIAWGVSLGDSLENRVTVVQGNQVITVPKNAKTDRIIAKEPCMNLFVQKGLGKVIRRRLKKVGVDLNDQSLNQRLAQMGSVGDDLVTLDLSSASDTVSIEIVRCLLPPDWFDALSACRSEKGVLPDGSTILYRKFSSMGNGFTFELESLIYWALCSACRNYMRETDRRMAIYGDDIIVPTGIARKVVEVLEFTGFIVNAKKSHFQGPFRESCGKHYFMGSDVTPIFFREKVDSYPRFIWACNQLKRWSKCGRWGLRSDFQGVYEFIRSHLRGYWSKPRIPDGMGDGALIGDFDEVVPSKAPNGWQGWRVTYFSESLTTFLPDESPILLKSLYQLDMSWSEIERLYQLNGSDEQDSSYLSVPTQNRRYRMARGVAWQWSDTGPWQG